MAFGTYVIDRQIVDTGLDGSQKTEHIWILLKRADDNPNIWLSVIPRYDLAAQGDTWRQAYENARVVLRIAVQDDATQGLPTAKRFASSTYMDMLSTVERFGKPIRFKNLSEECETPVIVQVTGKIWNK